MQTKSDENFSSSMMSTILDAIPPLIAAVYSVLAWPGILFFCWLFLFSGLEGEVHFKAACE